MSTNSANMIYIATSPKMYCNIGLRMFESKYKKNPIAKIPGLTTLRRFNLYAKKKIYTIPINEGMTIAGRILPRIVVFGAIITINDSTQTIIRIIITRILFIYSLFFNF